MGTMRCPNCGNADLNQLGAAEYKCPQCGTGFMLTGVQTSFVDIVLLQTGKKRTDVIMALREVTFKESLLTPLDLGTASRLVDNTPCVIQLSIPLDVAERVKTRLEKVGASIELKPA